MPKQTSPERNYAVESRSQIAIRGGIYQRRYFFFFTLRTTSLIKDLGLIGSRGDCLTGRKGERRWTEQEEKDLARKRGEVNRGLPTTFDSA